MKDTGITPEEECFWLQGCTWTGLTPNVPIPPEASSWRQRDVLPLGEAGRCRCQAHPPAPGQPSRAAATACFRGTFGGVLGHVGWKLENRMKLAGNILEKSSRVATLPKTLHCLNTPFFLKHLFFPTLSMMAVACPGLPQPTETTQQECFDKALQTQSISLFLRTPLTKTKQLWAAVGRVAWGLSSGKHYMVADKKHLIQHTHSVIFASPLSGAFDSVKAT